jgi:hypothetical protein
MLLEKKAVTLRTVAERVGLAPCSVSAVLNNTPASWAIPQRTKDRVLRAAAQLNYRPNLSARSLRTKRTHMIAVLSLDFGQASVARMVAGMERALRRRGYLLILGSLESAAEWERTCMELQQRGIEGVIAVGVTPPSEVTMPVVVLGLESVALGGRDGAGAWFQETGESAVDAVLRMIETKATPQSTKIVPKFPSTYADLSRFDLPGVGLTMSEVRDAS